MIIAKNRTETYFKNDSRALFITFTDQKDWGLNNKKNKLGLNNSADTDENWRLCFSRYFKDFTSYDISKQANSQGIIAANQELIEFVKAYKPEYIIHAPVLSGIVTIATLLELKKAGSKIVGYFYDDDVLYDSSSKYISPYLDYCVTLAHPDFVEKYAADGGNAFFSPALPMASDIFRKLQDNSKLYDVSFVGNQHVADRQLWIENLVKAGIDIELFGGVGSRKKVHYYKFVEVINQSKINLHFSKNVINGELVDQLKGRVFEVTLCGGFLLCEYAPILEHLFEIDKEIVCFKTLEEAVEKINYYLKNDAEREQIAKNGYIRANKEYEGLKVVEKLFAEIESNDKKIKASALESVTPLHSHFSEVYTLWTKALLRSSYPLRAQWKECAQLALRTDPGNKKVKRILLVSKLLGDPQSLLGLYKLIHWNIATWINDKYVIMRKKLRFIKEMIKNKRGS